MFSKEKNFYGGHGIVGANVPLGAGIAFANRYRNNGAVCLTYFGDGAANQGQVYESFNMAKLWKLPVVFVIENNKYAMGTSVERSAATTDFSQRGRSFDIPGEQVDGMDVRAVKATGDRVVEWVRQGNGPYILEMLTYRYRGHSMSDPGKYRTREEVEEMMKSDPIILWGRRLVDQERFTQAELDQADREVLAQIEESAQFAESSPFPTPESLYEDVYVRSPYMNMKAAEKDPAWKAATREDRVPEELPPSAPPPPPPTQAEAPPDQKASAPAPDPATAAAQAVAKLRS
jgi:pyruvate dehydrogenase E1 component alpha subunit